MQSRVEIEQIQNELEQAMLDRDIRSIRNVLKRAEGIRGINGTTLERAQAMIEIEEDLINSVKSLDLLLIRKALDRTHELTGVNKVFVDDARCAVEIDDFVTRCDHYSELDLLSITPAVIASHRLRYMSLKEKMREMLFTAIDRFASTTLDLIRGQQQELVDEGFYSIEAIDMTHDVKYLRFCKLGNNLCDV